MKQILEYLKANWPLAIVLAVILVMVIVLIVLLATEISRSKKQKAKAAAEAAKPAEETPAPVEPAPAETPAPVEPAPVEPTPVESAPVEPAPVEPAPVEPAPVEPVPATPAAEETPAEEPATEGEQQSPFIFVAVKEENRQPNPKPKKNAPVAENKEEEMKTKPETKKPEPKKAEPKKEAKAAPAKKAEPKAAAAAPAKKEAAGATGKWVIDNVKGKYWLSLIAPNGQVMLESPTAYASLSSAKSGIKTYQDNIAAGRLEITEHKNGDSQVQVLNARGGLLATSSTYSSNAQAESALASIKRWAATTVIKENGEEDKK